MSPAVGALGAWDRVAGVVIALGVGVLANMAMDVQVITLFRNFELKTIDFRFQWRGRRPVGDDIVLITVDEKSIERLGQWPWPRAVHALLIEHLREARAGVIAFDIFFTEPDRYGDERPTGFATDLARELGDDFRRAFRQEYGVPFRGQNDEALALAARRAGNVFFAVFGLEQAVAGGQAAPLPPAQQGLLEEFAVPRAVLEGDTTALPRAPYIRPPIASVMREAAGIGFVDFPADGDGVYRRAPLFGIYEPPASPGAARIYPALGLVVAKARQAVAYQDVRAVLGEQLSISGRPVVPLDRRGRLWVDYVGGARSFRRYSYVDVLQGDVPAKHLAGRVVLVGNVAAGLGDIRPSPFGGGVSEVDLFYGVEHQANIIASLLEERGLRPLSETASVLLVYALALVAGLIVPRTSPLWAATGAAAVLVAYDLLALHLFAADGRLLEIVPENGVIVLATAGILVTRLRTEERRRRALRDSMGLYLPAHIVDELAHRPGRVALGGERREISVLFCDIRGFTAYADQVPSEDAVALLNRFFDAMDEIVWRHEGLIDKYIGDSVMAIFGAPHDQPDHAVRAVQAALDMVREIQATQDEWAFLGFADMRVGIGVATGQATVGNVGSGRLVQYTAVGDTVNLASRLEQLTKEYDVSVLANERAREEAAGVAQFAEAAQLTVRGIGRPLRVFRVTEATRAGGHRRQAVSQFEGGSDGS